MKTSTLALRNLLATGSAQVADLLTITNQAGTVTKRYTDADMKLTWAGNDFVADEITFTRGPIKTVVGIEVDTLSLTIYAKSTDLFGGVPFLQALHNGALDLARVRLQRAYATDFASPIVGVIECFTGEIADIDPITRVHAQMTVNSDFHRLNMQIPRNLYQAGCIHTLFDAGCALSKAAFIVNGSTASGSTKSTINSALGQAANYFALGTIEFTSGVNNGLKRTVKSFSGGTFTLSYPLPVVPGIGDTFSAFPGCDKTQATCTNKFSNIANFRGFPFIPVAETGI